MGTPEGVPAAVAPVPGDPSDGNDHLREGDGRGHDRGPAADVAAAPGREVRPPQRRRRSATGGLAGGPAKGLGVGALEGPFIGRTWPQRGTHRITLNRTRPPRGATSCT